MRSAIDRSLNYNFADDKDRDLARESSRTLSPLIASTGKVDACFEEDGVSIKVSLPAAVFPLLLDILSNMANGNAITIVPVNAELTTQQAADILQVSRPFLVGLLKNGKIPSRKVGTHRRIAAKDLMDFRRANEKARNEVLDKLARETQELGLEY